MTDSPHKATPHRATPEQWRRAEENAGTFTGAACLLELRDILHETRNTLAALERRVYDIEEIACTIATRERLNTLERRVEALEPAPAAAQGSLVEVVRQAMDCLPERYARAAIAAVSDWLEKQGAVQHANSLIALRREVSQ